MLYFLYLVAGVLLLMNLLIAILNNTYAGVVEQADIGTNYYTILVTCFSNQIFC